MTTILTPGSFQWVCMPAKNCGTPRTISVDTDRIESSLNTVRTLCRDFPVAAAQALEKVSRPKQALRLYSDRPNTTRHISKRERKSRIQALRRVLD